MATREGEVVVKIDDSDGSCSTETDTAPYNGEPAPRTPVIQGSPEKLTESFRRRSKELPEAPSSSDGAEAVIQCSSNASFSRSPWKPPMSKTKSRLLDLPEEVSLKSDRTAASGRSHGKDDDASAFDDPDLEDIPEEYRKWKFSALTLLQWTILVKVLALSFHVNAFFDRIQEALFNQYVLETLSGPPMFERRPSLEEEIAAAAEIQEFQKAGAAMPRDLRATLLHGARSGRVVGSGHQNSPRVGKSPTVSRPASGKQDEGIPVDHLHKLNQKNVSAWNMRKMVNIIRHGALTTLDEQILDSDMGDNSSLMITTESQAKDAARKIFFRVAKPGSPYIYLKDLMQFLVKDEALKTFRLFGAASEDDKISKTALRNWVVNAFKDRRALAFSLNDTKTAVDELHNILNVLVTIVILIIWLIILDVHFTHFLLLMSSQLLLVVFIFGNTCKTVFEAIIFLFVMHPFDVGDRCEVDGVQMVVEEMNILTTVFLKFDNHKIIYPNSVLATKAIANYRRSPDMGDAIDFCVHISTPLERVATMKGRIQRYIEDKKDHWYDAPMLIMRDVEELNKLKISVWLTHKMNHQDMLERWHRRSLLIEEMIKVFRELDIEYRLLPLDVNIRAMPSSTSNKFPSN
ncbi:hypothetical protein PS1_042810 [Malus domestica]